MAFKKGCIPYNKGIKSDKSAVAKMTEAIRKQYVNGRKPWNKGLKTGLVPKSAFKNGHEAPNTAFKKQQKPWNTGVHFIQISGENNHNWKGGITKDNHKIRESLESKLWRDGVYSRDLYECQMCGKIGGKLNIHHIRKFSDYPEVRFDKSNGITLCEKCHKSVNGKEEQWESYFMFNLETRKLATGVEA